MVRRCRNGDGGNFPYDAKSERFKVFGWDNYYRISQKEQQMVGEGRGAGVDPLRPKVFSVSMTCRFVCTGLCNI